MGVARASQGRLAAYTCAVFGLWMGYVAWFYPAVSELGPWKPWVNETVRALIFLGPIALLGLRCAETPAATSARQAWLEGTGWALGWFGMAAVVGVTLQGRELSLEAVTLTKVMTVMGVACWVEEVAFRGALLRGLRATGARAPILVSAVAFVAIHWPGWWLLEMQPNAQAWVVNSGSILLLGLTLGWLYERHQRIGPCCLVHAANNAAATVLVAG